MYTLGATYYFDNAYIDNASAWHLSGLGRYETNSTKHDRDIRPRADFHIEWGLGKTLSPAWTVGLTAYTHWQVTSDSGCDVTWDASIHDRFYSLGSEVLYFHAPAKTFPVFFSCPITWPSVGIGRRPPCADWNRSANSNRPTQGL